MTSMTVTPQNCVSWADSPLEVQHTVIKELINIFEAEITTFAGLVPENWCAGSENWNKRYFFKANVSYTFGHNDCVNPLQQHARVLE